MPNFKGEINQPLTYKRVLCDKQHVKTSKKILIRLGNIKLQPGGVGICQY